MSVSVLVAEVRYLTGGANKMGKRIMVVDDVRLGRVDVKGKGAALKVAKARYSKYTVTKVVPYMGHTTLHDVYGHPKGFTSSGKCRG